MPEKTRKPGKFRLGLAGRVVAIGCAAAVAATLAQWVITPTLLRKDFERARLVYASNAAQQLSLIAASALAERDTIHLSAIIKMMSSPLPDGQAAILDVDGKIVATTAADAAIAGSTDIGRLAGAGGGAVQRGGTMMGVYPVHAGQDRIGSAIVTFRPITLTATWVRIIASNGLVLILALSVLAPFMLPLARQALAPVTALEKGIRKRTATDKSKLSDGVDDMVLKPLLSAIDEVHERSEAATRRALRMAFADPVTRLPNRLRFMSKLEGLVDRGVSETTFLVIADLDGFRKINVSLGPRLADEVLVSERLKACAGQVSRSFFLGRLGPDQFGVIAPGADQAVVKGFMAMADRALAEPMIIDGQTLRVTASFGAASGPTDALTATELFKRAELALKEAKRTPTDRLAFFDRRILDKATQLSRLEAELRAGLDRGEFVAVFQPKVDLHTGELVGAEALARWRRPDGSVVSPGVFVPIAEEMGLISKLGNCVLRDACFAAAAWNKAGHKLRIAVNVSPHQFNDPEFIGSVYAALEDSGLDPKMLELEVTESAAVSDPDRVARTMWPLRNRGVRLAIDDFGTGHSNFTSLTRLPFDVFKIDQQFIRALSSDPHAPAIVEMILAMAEALGQETVAEGVETREQAEFLVRRNCTIGQGYYYSPPLPSAEFDAFVRSWRPRPAASLAA